MSTPPSHMPSSPLPTKKEYTSEKTASATDANEQSIESVTGINEKALMRKIDSRLLPAVTVLYLCSFLDRSNVGNAKIEGLVEDLHMTGNQYLTSLTVFFIGYVLFEIPCNIILKRTSPKFWLPTLTVLWGTVCTLMGVSQNRPGFVAVRFFLGVAESGLFAGVVYYLSMWYKRSEVQFRVALFFSAASLAGAFGGILAWGIAHMKGVGGYNGWRWIFILEGLLTVVVGTCAYLFIFNYPETAGILTSDERAFIQERLKQDNDSVQDEAFTWFNVSKALKDPKIWLYGLSFHTVALPLYTITLFLPTIIKELGYSAAKAQLLTIPPYAFAFILTITIGFVSERAKRRAPFIMACSSFAIVGYIILLSDHRAGVSYVGVMFAVGGIYPSVALVFSWPANNVSGQTKRAVATAMMNSIGTSGAILGTQLYRQNTQPRFYLGHSFAMGYLVVNVCLTAILWRVLTIANARREKSMANKIQSETSSDETEWLGDEDVRYRFRY